MNGVLLERPELAWLLAAVEATGLVGVEDPQLFPTTEQAQDVTYGEGRQMLERSGWIKPLDEHPGEYDLNPDLFLLVGVAAAPEVVVATSRAQGEDAAQQVLHYLVGDYIAELWATAEERYFLALVPDRQRLQGRIGELLRLAEAAPMAGLRLSQANFKKLIARAQKGQAAQAAEVLETAGLNHAAAESLLAAVASPARGQVVVARTVQGQIEGGRRVEVYGEGDAAWIAVRLEADAKELELSRCDREVLAALVAEWISQLSA